MNERTLEQAMAHAAIVRQNGPRYDREEGPHEFDVVLLADEILRLRLYDADYYNHCGHVIHCRSCEAVKEH